MESPNSLIILIPLLDSNKPNSFSTKSFKSVPYLQYDREKNFGSWEKLNILKTKPVERKNKEDWKELDNSIKEYESYLKEGKIQDIYDKAFQDLIDAKIDLEHPVIPFDFSDITKVGIKGTLAFVILISIQEKLKK